MRVIFREKRERESERETSEKIGRERKRESDRMVIPHGNADLILPTNNIKTNKQMDPIKINNQPPM